MKRRIFRKIFAYPFHVPGFLEILEFGTFFRRIDDRGIVFQGRRFISWISRFLKFRESKFVFRGDARSNTICEHFQFVIVSRASSPKHNSGSSKSRIFTRREISRIRISPDIFTQYFSHSTKSPKSNSKSRKFQYLSIRQEMSARNSTEKSQRNDNAKISRSKIIKSSVRNWRRTKERSFPSEIMTPRFLRGGTRWGRGGHEFVSRSIYPCRPFRLGEGTTRRGLLPKLGAEFSPGRHLAALSAPVHVERSQRPVIVAWDRVAGIAQPPRPPTLPTPRPSNNETRGEEDVHERASHEQIDERTESIPMYLTNYRLLNSFVRIVAWVRICWELLIHWIHLCLHFSFLFNRLLISIIFRAELSRGRRPMLPAQISSKSFMKNES